LHRCGPKQILEHRKLVAERSKNGRLLLSLYTFK
jgi:hypothetical protein